MNALDLLTTRRSNKNLVAPAPNATQLAQIFQAALHVPDHGKMKPYHFVVIEKEGLSKFEQLLKAAYAEFNLDEKSYAKAERLAQQSPMIIAVIAKIQPHIAKVPEWEQLVTAGCAAYAMQLAANALGFDNVWITAKWVNGSALRQALGCGENDQIVALLRIGSAEKSIDCEAKILDHEKFIHYL